MSYHSQRIYAPAIYAATLNGPTGTRLVVGILFERALAGKPFTPSQEKLARMLKRSSRTVRRWITIGVKRGWIRVIRRGRMQTNLYRVSRPLWARLTGQHVSRMPRELQDTLWRLESRFGKVNGWKSRPGAGRPR